MNIKLLILFVFISCNTQIARTIEETRIAIQRVWIKKSDTLEFEANDTATLKSNGYFEIAPYSIISANKIKLADNTINIYISNTNDSLLFKGGPKDIVYLTPNEKKRVDSIAAAKLDSLRASLVGNWVIVSNTSPITCLLTVDSAFYTSSPMTNNFRSYADKYSLGLDYYRVGRDSKKLLRVTKDSVILKKSGFMEFWLSGDAYKKIENESKEYPKEIIGVWKDVNSPTEVTFFKDSCRISTSKYPYTYSLNANTLVVDNSAATIELNRDALTLSHFSSKELSGRFKYWPTKYIRK